MTIDGARTIGLIGAGNIGSQVARAAIVSGYDVVISNSRGPETLADLVTELGPRSRAGTSEEAAAAGDLVVVAVPLKAIGDVPAEPLVGKTVIDTNNYYPRRDRNIAALDEDKRDQLGAAPGPAARRPRGEGLQPHLCPPDHDRRQAAGYAQQKGAGDRRRRSSRKTPLAELIDGFGFDVVDAGPLAESWRIQPGTPGYVQRLNTEELTSALAAAKRLSWQARALL